MEAVFWAAVAGVLYPYVGYPLLLWLLSRRARQRDMALPNLPSVSIIIPAHNEARTIARKMANTAALDYPSDRMEVVFVSDGSTDDTVDLVRSVAGPWVRIVELPNRQGKAAALNAAIERATGDILVFTDASIELEAAALTRIVQPFADETIGCVSGEDRIAGSGGEAWYGRYELLLRRLESAVHSIVGASGSFYAQRRHLCQPFVPGLAPDFLSVLRTVAQGTRAVSEPRAVGAMAAVTSPKDEFERKVRTLLRGMTTLFAHPQLLNPFRHPTFAFLLFSHKIARWLVPVSMIVAFAASAASASEPLYAMATVAQATFYGCAVASLFRLGGIENTVIGRVALYFAGSNAAVLIAWVRYARGVRQELWTPTRR